MILAASAASVAGVGTSVAGVDLAGESVAGVDLAGEVIHARLHPRLVEFGQPCLHLAGSRPDSDAVIGRHTRKGEREGERKR